jgi:phytoene/squalene synthetase
MTLAAPALDIGSASHHALSDDRLKDQDNLAFLAGQPADARAAFLAVCAVLRELDRIIEAARAARDHGRLERLREAWHALWTEGRVLSGDEARVLRRARELWLADESISAVVAGASFDEYLAAVCEYSRPGVELRGIWEHNRMLMRISGAMFRLFPFVQPHRLRAIGHFGALDHFFNNLRDVQEDAEAELVFFPREVLDRFGVRRGYIATGRAVGTPEFRALMTFWLDDYLPAVRERARGFIDAADLHPSLASLRASCLHRYRRVERVLRGLDFDYRRFPAVYEAEVRREIAERALGGGVKEIA